MVFLSDIFLHEQQPNDIHNLLCIYVCELMFLPMNAVHNLNGYNDIKERNENQKTNDEVKSESNSIVFIMMCEASGNVHLFTNHCLNTSRLNCLTVMKCDFCRWIVNQYNINGTRLSFERKNEIMPDGFGAPHSNRMPAIERYTFRQEWAHTSNVIEWTRSRWI